MNCIVYYEKLIGLNLALKIMEAHPDNRSVAIFLDSQAAIAIKPPRQQSGQYLIKYLIRRLAEGRKHPYLHWVRARKGVPENKAADMATKNATGWRKSGRRPRAPATRGRRIPTSAVRTEIRTQTRAKRAEAWRPRAIGRAIHKITKEPTIEVLWKFKQMTRPETSVIVQARTEKIGLRPTCTKPGVEPTLLCPFRFRRQTVHHTLLECPGFNELREKMWAGKRMMDLTKLLGISTLATRVFKILLATGKVLQFRRVNEAEASDAVDSD